MVKFNQFSETEIPYNILSSFGFSQEMIDDLPQNIMQRFLSARTTPVLPVVTVDENGDEHISYSKLCLLRLDDGSVDVGFVPMWREKELDEFNEQQVQQLLKGNVIIANFEDRGQCYVQYDDSIKQTITIPVSIISHNLDVLAQSSGMSEFERERLKEGNVIELDDNGQQTSIGIDLNEVTGCRISQGDAQMWKEEARASQLPKYNFGLYGCWICDEVTQKMSYVAEENYTQEMLEEMKRIGQQKAANVQMGGFRR